MVLIPGKLVKATDETVLDSVTAAGAIAAASETHAAEDIAGVNTALDALGAKINAILDVMNDLGVNATP